MPDIEEVQAVRRSIAIVKSTRASADERDYHARILASKGIDPAAPEAPPHPFRYGRHQYFPVGMTKEAALVHLKVLAARAPRGLGSR